VTASKELMPRLDSFPVGEVVGVPSAIAPVCGAVKIDDVNKRTGILFGVVQNSGAGAFTFSVEESSDDGDADAYAAINIRVDEVAVASVVVQPGARVMFAIEPSEITDNYLRFKAASTSLDRHGYVVIGAWVGDLTRWQSRATA
jgi:hypothetical protein